MGNNPQSSEFGRVWKKNLQNLGVYEKNCQNSEIGRIWKKIGRIEAYMENKLSELRKKK